MKKQVSFLMAIVAASMLLFACKSKITDEALTAAVNEKVAAMSDIAGANVTVKEGVVTVTGECKDQTCSDKCKTALEAAKVEGVKSIDWKCTIAPPPPPPTVEAPASINTVLNETVVQTLKDGLKDIKGITVDYTTAKPAIVGSVTAVTRMKIMQIFSMAKVVPDVTKLVTIK
jgi:hyperosmotically inducible protein